MGALQVAVLVLVVAAAAAWKVCGGLGSLFSTSHRLLSLCTRSHHPCSAGPSPPLATHGVPLLIASFKVPPPQGKVSSAQAANATTTSSLVVQTLQASAEFSNEAHGGVGWTSVFISLGTNAFCSLSYTQYWGQTVPSQTGW
jgi:hypothetical protein